MALTINSFNVGSNLSVQISDDFGDIFSADQLGHLTDFDATSEATVITIRPITNGGKVIHRRIPGGWIGRLMFERYSGAMINLIAGLDALFYATGLDPAFAIGCVILNPDGSTDKYTFTQVKFNRESFGNFRGNSNVPQSLPFNAQELIIPNNATTLLAALGIAA